MLVLNELDLLNNPLRVKSEFLLFGKTRSRPACEALRVKCQSAPVTHSFQLHSLSWSIRI
ncbi:hypothetical protein C7B80_26080 [Cyanosarcina cf. burmensis CCALA 770]|nr:hypothetical protein C7B80_26080 [Cyanosarcina cf. burmensis CCALA 770]